MRRLAHAVLYVSSAFALWWMAVWALSVPDYILPAPDRVLLSLWELPGFYASHAAITAQESILGLLIGSFGGILVGLGLAFGGRLGRIFQPVVVASQTFPKEALAPLFVVVLGFGIAPKVVISALICFFPLAVNTHRGLSEVPEDYLALARICGATRWERFAAIEWPSALPFVLAGFRVASTLAVIGAVVGEFVGSNGGLGHVIRAAGAEIATERIYAALLLLGLLGSLLYGAAAFLESRLTRFSGRVRTA